MLSACRRRLTGRRFTIAHLSDLHCGGQYFVPGLLERAISEINDLEPDIVVCSGDLTTFGFKHEYEQARRYLDKVACESIVVIPGNHDSRNVGYVHFEELFGERNSVLRVGPATVVAVDSTEPDLDHGQIGRGRYRWIEEQFAQQESELRIFVCHHHLLPVPGTGRERNVVYDAGDAIECLQRAGVHLVLSGHKHVPYAWKLENLFVVNTGTVSSLRLRGNTRPCYNVIEVVREPRRRLAQAPVPRTGADHPVLDRHLRVREVHGADRGRGDDPLVTRALALIDGEHYAPVVRDALEELPYEFVAAHLVGGTEKLRGDEDYGVVARRRSRRARSPSTGRSSSSTSRTSRCSARRSASGSRAACSPPGLPYVGADFRFDPPELEPFPLPSIAIIGTGKRVGKTAVTAHAARLLRARPGRRRRRDGTRRAARARGGEGRARRRRACSSSRAPGGTPPPTTSRPRRSPASRPSAAAAAAAGSPGRSPSRTSTRARSSRSSSRPDLVLFDGSGAAIPPVETSRRVLVVGAATDRDVATGYLNALPAPRLRPRRPDDGRSGLRLGGAARRGGRARAARAGDDAPAAPGRAGRGATVAFFSTAPEAAHDARRHLRDEHGADVVHVSGSLADRTKLREELEHVDAEVFLVELKAAAIDVVAEAARERGVDVVLAGNDVLSVDGQDLDAELLRLAPRRRL